MSSPRDEGRKGGLLELVSRLRREGLTEELRATLLAVYDDRYRRALEAVAEGRVRLYRFVPSGLVAWVVEGQRRDYLVIPLTYCDCEDFLLNVVLRAELDACYHILAQAIAEALGKYRVIELPDDLYERFLEEWLRP